MSQAKMGRWAFVIGLIIAVLLGFVSFSYSSLLLVILGLIVGFLNVSEKEATGFLIAVIALLLVGVAGLKALDVMGSLYTWIQTVLTSFTIFVSASAVVVAIKELFAAGRE
jgi:fructose-specific phosphotransferase system IIC component